MHATHGLGDVYDVMTCDFDDDDKQHDNRDKHNDEKKDKITALLV